MRFGWRCRGALWEVAAAGCWSWAAAAGVLRGHGVRGEGGAGGGGGCGAGVRVGRSGHAGVAGGRGGSVARAGRAEWKAAARKGQMRA